MRRSKYQIATEINDSQDFVLVVVQGTEVPYADCYAVFPRLAALSDLMPVTFRSAQAMRRALPGLVQTWKVELVRRSQLELTM